jgi:hypothetical protein
MNTSLLFSFGTFASAKSSQWKFYVCRVAFSLVVRLLRGAQKSGAQMSGNLFSLFSILALEVEKVSGEANDGKGWKWDSG